MRVHKIAIPLNVSEALKVSEDSAGVLPVICDLFPPETAELVLCAVTPPLTEFLIGDHAATTHASPGQTLSTHYEAWDSYRRELEERLVQEASRLRAAGYHVRTHLLSGDTVHEIVSLLEQNNFSLVAMATNGSEGLHRPIFGSTVEQISHLVSVPVLLVNSPAGTLTKAEAAQQPVRLLNPRRHPIIAVATDGSQHSQEALLLATRIAPVLNATLKVLVTVSDRHGAAHDQQVMTTIQALVHEQAVDFELAPLVGSVDTVVERYLEQHPVDLFVLGAFKDRGAASSAAIGVSAQRVAQNAPVSMWVVKGQQKLIRRILVNVDVGDASLIHNLIDRGIQFAKVLGAEVHFLYVYPAPREESPQRLSGRDALSRLFIDDAQVGAFLQTIVKILETWGIDRRALEVWRGDPLKTILNLTRSGDYDLLVVESHSTPQFFQSTLADAVLRNAPTSILIARNQQGVFELGDIAGNAAIPGG